MDRIKFEVGPIRPPFHANSLLLRVTENCTWNKCNFCTLYRGGKFMTRPVEVIKKDIDNVAVIRDMIMKYHLGDFEFDMDGIMAQYHSILDSEEKDCYSMVFNWIRTEEMKNVFLQDANSMVIKPEKMAEIVRHIKKTLPSVELIAAYGRADTLVKITQDEFHMLREAGLNMLHSGFESGCREVLELLNKGCTPEQQIDAGIKAKKAKIEFNVFYMPGAGGRNLSHKNALDTAEVISEINPDFVRIRTFVVKPGTPMWDMQKAGKFDECTDMEKLLELKDMLSHIKNCDGYVISDHIINLLSRIEGHMDKDLKGILNYIDEFLSLEPTKQRNFQLARRMGFGGDFNRMEFLSDNDINRISQVEKEVTDPADWEQLMRRYLVQYI